MQRNGKVVENPPGVRIQFVHHFRIARLQQGRRRSIRVYLGGSCMRIRLLFTLTAAVACSTMSVTAHTKSAATTVLYQGKATQLAATLPDVNDLWIGGDDLTRVNGFVLKPEGLCRDAICVPMRQDEDSD